LSLKFVEGPPDGFTSLKQDKVDLGAAGGGAGDGKNCAVM